MSRYGTPFSDEELLEELNKLGYDEVSPDVFNMMKDDLAELVEKEPDDLPLSEYDNDISPLSSKFLSTSSDALVECRTEQKTSKKTDSSLSRKVKKKSQKKSRAINNRDSERNGSESSRCQNTGNALKIKSSSNASLDYVNTYDTSVEDAVAEIDDYDKYDSVDELKYEDNYLTSRNSRADVNRNEDMKYKSISNSYKPKERDFQLSYGSRNDRITSNSEVSVNKYRSNALKDTKYTSSWGKSYDQIHNLSNPQKTATDNSLKNVKDAFKTFKLDRNSSESDEFLLNNYRGSDVNLNSSQSSTSSETKMIKRKVLRRRNGRSVITEELVEIPNIFDTSYPESDNFNSSKSFSSDDLSCKSNGSTGSVTAVSPESIKSSPSTFSLLSTRSTSLRVPRKKKSDPVAMYGYYKKFWDNFKPPGENTHDRLRWAVRDKMLEYNI